MTHYINFYGAPGAGKSTLAAGLFYTMKMNGERCELVSEVAKDLVWENRFDTLQHQIYVAAKQYRNLARVKGKVDYVITDGGLLNSVVYGRYYDSGLPQDLEYIKLLIQALGSQTNLMLTRTHAYETAGRYQSEKESDELAGLITGVFAEAELPYTTVSSGITPVDLYHTIKGLTS